MHRNHVRTAGAAALATTLALATAQIATAQPATAAVAHAAAAAAAAAPKVSITIKGKTRTLLAPETVRVKSGWITRDGAPVGKCPAASAQGALNVATHGRWKGKWYGSYHEYFITGILGDNETSKKYYWALYVNGRSSSKGACEVKLRPGEKLLFKVAKA